jgi:uncharacterized Tic20 family protein
MNNTGAAGAIPVVNILDYLQPGINRPDLYYERAYPVQSIGSGTTRSLIQASGGGSTQSTLIDNANYTNNTNNTQSIQRHTATGAERTPLLSLYYTIGLIILSAAIFLTIAAWSNVLLSWFDSIYVSPAVNPITKSRLYFAITLTIISFFVIIILLLLWYYFTIYQGL